MLDLDAFGPQVVLLTDGRADQREELLSLLCRLGWRDERHDDACKYPYDYPYDHLSEMDMHRFRTDIYWRFRSLKREFLFFWYDGFGLLLWFLHFRFLLHWLFYLWFRLYLFHWFLLH